jgi:hypothetical protein
MRKLSVIGVMVASAAVALLGQSNSAVQSDLPTAVRALRLRLAAKSEAAGKNSQAEEKWQELTDGWNERTQGSRENPTPWPRVPPGGVSSFVKARTSDRSVIDYAAGEPHAPEELKDRYLKLQPKQRSFLNALVSARQAAVSAETRSSREETEVVGEIIVSLLLKESFGQGCVIEGPDVEKNPTLGFLDEGWIGTLTESGELPLDYLVTEPASMRLTQAVSHVVDKLKQELKEAEKPKKSVEDVWRFTLHDMLAAISRKVSPHKSRTFGETVASSAVSTNVVLSFCKELKFRLYGLAPLLQGAVFSESMGD